MASRVSSRLLILALAGWNGLCTLGRRRPPADPARILVAHHLLLGDTLMLTPLLAKLRRQYPLAEIVMTTPKAIAPLYHHRPYGVKAMPFDPRDPESLRNLRSRRGFDLAIVPGDNRYSWLALALGSKWSVAFAGDRPAYKSWPVDKLVPYPAAPAAWGDMVAELIDGPPAPPFAPADWREPECEPFDPPRKPYCVLHVGASSALKLWDNGKWMALAEHLRAKGYQVVWSGGRGEEQTVAGIDPHRRYPSYAGKLDLAQLWRLVRHAALLVCPDTGVAHLGRIVDTPTVTLFGPGSAVICGAGRFWRASPFRAVTVEDFPCRDQRVLFKREIAWVRRCGRSLRECPAPACMQAIDLQAVKAGIAQVLPPAGTALSATDFQ
ncbi:MAG: glycosyltransferase family 9 protein [Betaproteobacteria bacterium]|nr:glycosyltransferase family 9 protein [Betaproteobacteria bacterium]